MITILAVVAATLVAYVVVKALKECRAKSAILQEFHDRQVRVQDNLFVRKVYVEAGGRHYPHMLASGKIAWYRTDHDYAMDV